MTEYTIVVQKLLDTAWHVSISTADIQQLISKLIILSLKYINKQAVWDAVFESCDANYVDWTLVRPDFNALSDLYYWIPILEECHWVGLESIQRPLQHMRVSLRRAGLDTDNNDLACRLLILHLLHGVPVLYGFEMLLCRTHKRDTHQAAAVLLANVSEVLHTPQDYEACLKQVVSPKYFRVNVEKFQKHIDFLKSHEAQIVSFSKVQSDYLLATTRPRLRDLLIQNNTEKVTLDTKMGTWESYTAFCQLHQFPNILNEHTKQKLYFLASQCTWDWKPYVSIVAVHSKELSHKIMQYPVSKPDINTLHACIQRLNMNGRPPFPELIQFKNCCFINFPSSQVYNMNLTHFLRLYVCIYQANSVWKELWKRQNALYSSQILHDCERFVSQHPFNHAEFFNFFH